MTFAMRALSGVLSCAAIAVAYSYYRYEQSSQAPSVAFADSDIDLGDGMPGETVTGVVKVANSGADIVVSVSGSCTCTSIYPHQLTLKRGEVADVSVSLKLPPTGVHVKSASLVVSGEGGGPPLCRCNVYAKSTPAVIVEPPFLTVSVDPSMNSVASHDCLLDFTDKATVADRSEWTVRVSNNIVIASRFGDRGIRVEPPSTLSALTTRSDTVEVVGANGDLLASIPVMIRVSSDIVVSPAAVTLRKNGVCRVVVRSKSADLGTLESWSAPEGVTVSQVAAAAVENRCVIRFDVSESFESRDGESVRLVFTGHVEEIMIPVRKPKGQAGE